MPDKQPNISVEYLPVSKLKPYKNNARKHEKFDIDAIAESIKTFGFCDPIGLWGDDVIVEGHGRVLAAKQLGMETVPCIRLDHLSDEERRAYALAHNQTSANSSWDEIFLPIELEAITEIDMAAFGFDVGSGKAGTEIVEDEFDPEPPEEPKSKRGQLYQLGDHRLMCGDSSDPSDFLTLMGGVKPTWFSRILRTAWRSGIKTKRSTPSRRLDSVARISKAIRSPRRICTSC